MASTKKDIVFDVVGTLVSYDAMFDINESGAIDIVDIINLVNQILEQT